jgi:myo-inositol-1(or 4)-monophosphatase
MMVDMKEEFVETMHIPDSAWLQEILIRVSEQEIVSRYRHANVRHKSDGSLVTDADLAVQTSLAGHLAAATPEIPLLGEEMGVEQQQALLDGGSYWCLDPLDGTTNFTTGLPFFAISLALVIDCHPVLGAVYDPMGRECYRAEAGQGAWLNDHRLLLEDTPETLKESLAMVDLKRLSTRLVRSLSERPPYRSQRSFGAIALEWCWLAAGRSHLYLHGGQKPWDYAAGRLIFAEAGGTAGDWADQPITGLAPVPAVGASNPTLYDCWSRWIADADPGFLASRI